jgi:Fe-S cluster biogenesis protein NfuA
MSETATSVERIQSFLRNHVAPELGLDASELEVVAFENGIATVRLTGVCASCPATLPTLLMSMEHELRSLAPEVEMIETVA